jgi:uncharacterized membrane protein
MTRTLFVLTLAAALGSGLMAGLFFAFSTSVMSALGRLPAAQGIAAMQSINVTIVNPVFLSVFLGTAVLSALLIAGAIFGWAPNPAWVVTGALLYIVGVIGITMFINVPMNDALAAIGPDTTAGAELWAKYLDRWVFWNHARTVAPLAGLAAFILALR